MVRKTRRVRVTSGVSGHSVSGVAEKAASENKLTKSDQLRAKLAGKPAAWKGRANEKTAGGMYRSRKNRSTSKSAARTLQRKTEDVSGVGARRGLEKPKSQAVEYSVLVRIDPKVGSVKFLDGKGGVREFGISNHEGRFLKSVIERVAIEKEVPSLGSAGADPVELAGVAISALPNTSYWDETLGPFFDTSGLCKWKGVSRQRLSDLRRESRLIGLRAADDKPTIVYPRFQFDDRGRLLPHLPEVWPVLIGAYSEWTAAAWLNTPDDEWDGRTAAEILRYGAAEDVEAIIQEAQRDAASMTAP